MLSTFAGAARLPKSPKTSEVCTRSGRNASARAGHPLPLLESDKSPGLIQFNTAGPLRIGSCLPIGDPPRPLPPGKRP